MEARIFAFNIVSVRLLSLNQRPINFKSRELEYEKWLINDLNELK